jgi:carbonic anhydrase
MGQGRSAMNVTDLLRECNRMYSRTIPRAELPVSPNLHLAVLVCMDVPRLRGLQLGDAHIVRSAGRIASDDAIRSLAVSQWVGDTQKIVFLHHTDCGVAKFRDEELAEESSLLRFPDLVRGFPYDLSTGSMEEAS